MSIFNTATALVLGAALLSGCGGSSGSAERQNQNLPEEVRPGFQRESIFDLFENQDSNQVIGVNKYIWRATLDTLNFLPLEGADPFSGVIVFNWGQIPGSSGVYRATAYIQDAALDARSLRLAMFRQGRGGSVPVTGQTLREIEDAILTRARQIRVAELNRNQ